LGRIPAFSWHKKDSDVLEIFSGNCGFESTVMDRRKRQRLAQDPGSSNGREAPARKAPKRRQKCNFQVFAGFEQVLTNFLSRFRAF
jgi:hypothetical protein